MTVTITPARYSYRRTITGGYNVRRGDEYLGGVKRDGRAWIITTTARGELPGEPARYATRTDAVDALSIMLRRAAELDAMPTDDQPAAELVVHPGDDRPSCPSCRYYSGHTSWCPRRHTGQPAEQTTLVIETNPGAPVHTVGNYVDPTPDGEVDRATPVADLDDRALWLQFMLEDREQSYGTPDDDRHGALLAAIADRFGPDATELTADWSVGIHMSSDDLVEWARDQYEHLIGVATGRIVPEWRRDDTAAGV